MSDSSSSPEELPKMGRARGRARGRAVHLDFRGLGRGSFRPGSPDDEHSPGLPRASGSGSPNSDIQPGQFEDPVVSPSESPPRNSPQSGSQDGKSPTGSGNGDDSNKKDEAKKPIPGIAEKLATIERGSRLDKADIVFSRENADVSKMGTAGNPISLVANYFPVIQKPNWVLRSYAVIFLEEEFDDVTVRKFLVRSKATEIGPNLFDGTTLYTTSNLQQPFTLSALTQEENPKTILFNLKFIKEIDPIADPMFYHFCNVTVRAAMKCLKLTQLGRNYYDGENGHDVARHRLFIWPGFISSMRRYDGGMMLCLEMTHKVLRQDTVLDTINELGRQHDLRSHAGREALKMAIVGQTVMTKYNKRTYRIDGVEFGKTVRDTFPLTRKRKNGPPEERMITFVDYYRELYEITLTSMSQPMLLSMPTRSDIRRGRDHPILLVPEICHFAGLTEEMRGNFNMMKDIGSFLHMIPKDRCLALTRFMGRLKETPAVRNVMEPWELAFDTDMVPIPGRVLGKEQILLGKATTEIPSDEANWTNAFRSKPLLDPKTLNIWVVIAPKREIEANNVDNFLGMMNRVGRGLGVVFNKPIIIGLGDTSIAKYKSEMIKMINLYKDKIDLIMTVLPNNKLELYSAIKKICYNDFGINSQCFVARNLTIKGAMSIATKLVVQINTKLGGIPWSIRNPLKDIMVVGFDVHHVGAGMSGGSVAAMVATTSEDLGRCCSVVQKVGSREELSRNMGNYLKKCFKSYMDANDRLPKRIIFYRDGVGEGQLGMVHREELADILSTLDQVYAPEPAPKFTFIVVNKRVNTRLFLKDRLNINNPPPGTVVDDVITLPERNDFFLIAQTVRQGTVGPTSYNVLYNSSFDLDADKIQKYTFKLTHIYYNYSGTISVPGVVQYAHKLAFLVGTAGLSDEINPNLDHLLYFL